MPSGQLEKVPGFPRAGIWECPTLLRPGQSQGSIETSTSRLPALPLPGDFSPEYINPALSSPHPLKGPLPGQAEEVWGCNKNVTC